MISTPPLSVTNAVPPGVVPRGAVLGPPYAARAIIRAPAHAAAVKLHHAWVVRNPNDAAGASCFHVPHSAMVSKRHLWMTRVRLCPQYLIETISERSAATLTLRCEA